MRDAEHDYARPSPRPSLEMRRDPTVYIAGEDVGKFGGASVSPAGLFKEFGPERVLDTPISEAAIVGHAVGRGGRGLRPVVEIMFMDFLPICMDELSTRRPRSTTCSAAR